LISSDYYSYPFKPISGNLPDSYFTVVNSLGSKTPEITTQPRAPAGATNTPAHIASTDGDTWGQNSILSATSLQPHSYRCYRGATPLTVNTGGFRPKTTKKSRTVLTHLAFIRLNPQPNTELTPQLPTFSEPERFGDAFDSNPRFAPQDSVLLHLNCKQTSVKSVYYTILLIPDRFLHL
jgi:hypothetical protein